MKKTFNILLLIVLTMAVLQATGCRSGGSGGPPAPTGPTDLSLYYYRALEQSGEIHVQWASNRPTSGQIRYGRTTLTDLVVVPSRADTHDVPLAGLQFAAHYIYRLTVNDSLGNSLDGTGDFNTPDKATPEPVILGLTIANVTESSARITWRTDEPATTILYYGRTSFADSIVNDTLHVEHEVILTNLISSSAYQLKPEAVDSTNLRGYGRDTSLVTLMRMTIYFPDTAVGLGDTVNLPIWIAGAQDVAALRFGFSFTAGSMELISIEEGPFFRDHNGFIFFQTLRNVIGEGFADLTWNINFSGNQRTGTDADGSGIVAYARLRGLNPGATQTVFITDSSFALGIFAEQRSCSLRAGNVLVQP
jgi:hypothetical protein